MWALDLVRHGLRWRVGCGTNINLWRDNWIPRDEGLEPFTPKLLNPADATVSMLINQQTGGWDEDLVRSFFWDIDAEDILRLPLPLSAVDDQRIWHFAKTGHYTVRSAYHLAQKNQKSSTQARTGSTTRTNDTDWNWIWTLKIPNKIRIFLWRLLKSSLPVYEVLS